MQKCEEDAKAYCYHEHFIIRDPFPWTDEYKRHFKDQKDSLGAINLSKREINEMKESGEWQEMVRARKRLDRERKFKDHFENLNGY